MCFISSFSPDNRAQKARESPSRPWPIPGQEESALYLMATTTVWRCASSVTPIGPQYQSPYTKGKCRQDPQLLFQTGSRHCPGNNLGHAGTSVNLKRRAEPIRRGVRRPASGLRFLAFASGAELTGWRIVAPGCDRTAPTLRVRRGASRPGRCHDGRRHPAREDAAHPLGPGSRSASRRRFVTQHAPFRTAP